MTRDDVMRETLKHVRRVGSLMLQMTEKLNRRAMQHDDSKFSAAEFETFAAETPTLRSLTYNSPEYKEALGRLGPALTHHYSKNSHHPEHHTNGIHDMDMLELLEMLADWKAATERHEDGCLRKSIEANSARFGYGAVLKDLLMRTATNLGWLD